MKRDLHSLRRLRPVEKRSEFCQRLSRCVPVGWCRGHHGTISTLVWIKEIANLSRRLDVTCSGASQLLKSCKSRNFQNTEVKPRVLPERPLPKYIQKGHDAQKKKIIINKKTFAKTLTWFKILALKIPLFHSLNPRSVREAAAMIQVRAVLVRFRKNRAVPGQTGRDLWLLTGASNAVDHRYKSRCWGSVRVANGCRWGEGRTRRRTHAHKRTPHAGPSSAQFSTRHLKAHAWP